MSDQRLFSAMPAACAAFGSVLSKLGGEAARLLELQARDAHIASEVPGRVLDLEVPVGSQGCDSADGPLPVSPSVVRGGLLVGELLVWVKDGRLIGLEQPWFTDEPPTTWPSVEELVFERAPGK